MFRLDQTAFPLQVRGIYPFDGEAQIKQLQTEVENTKINIYKSYPFDDKGRDRQRKILKREQGKLGDLEGARLTLRKASLEGYVDSLVLHKKLSLSALVHGEPLKEDPSHTLLSVLIRSYFHGVKRDKDIRDTVLSPTWQSIWSVHKPNPFDLHYATLNINQQQMIIYSKFYDRVFESQNSPSQDIINDHDALDGWQLFQNRAAKKEKMRSDIDDKLGVGNLSGDVFVPVANSTDAKQVQELNF